MMHELMMQCLQLQEDRTANTKGKAIARNQTTAKAQLQTQKISLLRGAGLKF